MRYEIEAATDTPTLILFDPAAVPAPPDRGVIDGEETLRRLESAGAVCVVAPDASGTALMHVYVDESIPEPLRNHAVLARAIRSFPIPSGRLRLAGMEEALRQETRQSGEARPTGQTVALPPGAYRLTLYRLDLPEGWVHETFRGQAPISEYLAWISMKVLIPLAVAAWIGLVAIFFTTVRVPYPDLAAPIFLLVFALPFVVRRLDVFAAARARFARLVREHPSWAVVLARPDDGP